MRRLGAPLIAAVFALAAPLAAATLPELFQKAREQVRSHSWREGLATLDRLDAESARPGNETARRQLVAPIAFYRGVCEASLDQAEKAEADFAAFRRAQPDAAIDEAMYSKKVVAAFHAAGKNAAFEREDHDAVSPTSPGPPSLARAFEQFQAAPNAAEKADEHWADGPVKWIMTAEETAAWGELTSAAGRAEFVERFWQSRNPKPGSEENPVRTELERRIAFADAYFRLDDKTRGSLTDEGMVFVLLGPPTRSGRKPIMANEERSISDGNSQDEKWWMGARNSIHIDGARLTDASGSFREIWHYGREALPRSVSAYELNVVFVTKTGYGRSVLQRAPATLSALEAARSAPLRGQS